ncbi:MAG: methionyl-tRNA formyltransferase [Candidatus Omnitrophota bacterium]
MKRYVFIGSVEFSASCLKAMLEEGVNIVEIMCPVKLSAAHNNDYNDLAVPAVRYGKKVHYFRNVSEEANHIKAAKPDVIFVIGFSQIVPESILRIPAIGCIGSHPALLPQNRGRHPLVWALANGLKKSGMTLFWLDRGVDSGDIWQQEAFNIKDNDCARSLYKRAEKIAARLLTRGVKEIERGVIRRKRQDHSRANYWRKRMEEDGRIDWRMSSKRICDLIRALSEPYPGAHCIYRGEQIKIWKAAILSNTDKYDNLEPGKVLSIAGREVSIKTGDGAVKIIRHTFKPLPKEGSYL